MASHNVSQTRKNAIMEAILAARLNPAEFVWTEDVTEATKVGGGRDPYTVEVLVHGATGYFSKFDVNANTKGPLLSNLRPWAVWREDGNPLRGMGPGICGVQLASRGWGGVRGSRPLGGAATWRRRDTACPVNTPFKPEEQTQIERQLREVAEYTPAHEATSRTTSSRSSKRSSITSSKPPSVSGGLTGARPSSAYSSAR